MADDKNACPDCKLRGASVDWQRFGGCPHGCGYIGEPVSYEEVKEDCICEENRLNTIRNPKCPQHGFKDTPSGPTI